MDLNAFFFLPVQLNPLDAVLHIQNIAEKDNFALKALFLFLDRSVRM